MFKSSFLLKDATIYMRQNGENNLHQIEEKLFRFLMPADSFMYVTTLHPVVTLHSIPDTPVADSYSSSDTSESDDDVKAVPPTPVRRLASFSGASQPQQKSQSSLQKERTIINYKPPLINRSIPSSSNDGRRNTTTLGDPDAVKRFKQSIQAYKVPDSQSDLSEDEIDAIFNSKKFAMEFSKMRAIMREAEKSRRSDDNVTSTDRSMARQIINKRPRRPLEFWRPETYEEETDVAELNNETVTSDDSSVESGPAETRDKRHNILDDLSDADDSSQHESDEEQSKVVRKPRVKRKIQLSDSEDEEELQDTTSSSLPFPEFVDDFANDFGDLPITISSSPQNNPVPKKRKTAAIIDDDDEEEEEAATSSDESEGFDEEESPTKVVQRIVRQCRKITEDLMGVLHQWRTNSGSNQTTANNSRETTPNGKDDEEAGLHISALEDNNNDDVLNIIRSQPTIINPELTLKSYQLVGLSWLNLLYHKNLSGILADEMGLGKTAQVIAFIALLKEKYNVRGPHLVIVPSSTMENWVREFERWCPSLVVKTYYGTQSERMVIRYELAYDNEFDVLVTTYNMVTGNKDDRSFLKKLKFLYMILDEGHMVKNVGSARHKHLTSIKTKFRLLLTGTPLQNNLQELMALLMFIMPDLFEGDEEILRMVFNGKNDKELSNEELIDTARKIMTPFILRRKKAQVLKELPQKFHKVAMCKPTTFQMEMYKKLVTDSRKSYTESSPDKVAPSKLESKKKLNNILMQLRKMALHPLLHRLQYSEDTLHKMSRAIMKEQQYWDANPDYIYEDMTLLSDFELHTLCSKSFPKYLSPYALPTDKLFDSGKLSMLMNDILPACRKRGDKVLVFSQFTIMLDILERVFEHRSLSFLRMDGQTPVQDRQSFVDTFQKGTVDVFLLSTKAGGFGINLTRANVVVLFDLDFNPQNDSQAEDRAHRVGQTRDVTVYRLITEGTVEEHIHRLAMQKIKLDKSISATSDQENGKGKLEEEVDVSTIMELLKAEMLQTDNNITSQ